MRPYEDVFGCINGTDSYQGGGQTGMKNGDE